MLAARHSASSVATAAAAIALTIPAGFAVAFAEPKYVFVLLSLSIAGLAALVAGVPWQGALLLTLLFAEQYAVDVDIGPASARVYIVGIALAWCVCNRALGGVQVIGSHRARRLVLALVVLMTWFTIAGIQQSRGLALVLSETGKGPLLALGIFVVVQALSRDRITLRALMAAFAVIAGLSATFAVLQWLNIGWAWDVAGAIRSGKGSSDVMLGLITGAGRIPVEEATAWVPGLTLFSVTLNVQLLAWGFVATLYCSRSPSRRKRIAGAVVGLLSLTAIVVSQQRAGLFALPMAVVVMTAVVRRRLGIWRVSARQFVRAATVLAVVLIAIVAVVQQRDLAAEGHGRYNLDRAKYDALGPRLEVAKVAIEIGAENPGFGSTPAFIDRATDQLGISWSPHNYFLTAFAFGGGVGLLLAIWVLLEACLLIRAGLSAAATSTTPVWIPLALAFGFTSYVANSMFHSASFLTGDPVPMWLLGGVAGCLANGHQSSPDA